MGSLSEEVRTEVLCGHICDLEAENAKLREFASDAFSMAFNFYHGAGTAEDLRQLKLDYRELGIEVD